LLAGVAQLAAIAKVATLTPTDQGHRHHRFRFSAEREATLSVGAEPVHLLPVCKRIRRALSGVAAVPLPHAVARSEGRGGQGLGGRDERDDSGDTP
jgi:hypothetical protein